MTFQVNKPKPTTKSFCNVVVGHFFRDTDTDDPYIKVTTTEGQFVGYHFGRPSKTVTRSFEGCDSVIELEVEFISFTEI